jgi:hypothetical protein
MAENTRRVTVDKEGKITGGFKPMPEGERRAKTTEELITEAELRAEYEAGKRQEAEKSYRSGLNSYMRGSNRPFMFKPRPEDAKEANDARGSSIGQRDKNMGDQERFDEANDPKGFKKGGKVSSASSRADGIAQRGKTRGRML